MFIWMYVSKSVSLWWFYVSESVRYCHCYVSKSVPCSVQRYPIAYRGKGRNKHKGHFAAQLSYGASWHISHTLFYAAIPPTKEHHKYAVIRSFPTIRTSVKQSSSLIILYKPICTTFLNPATTPYFWNAFACWNHLLVLIFEQLPIPSAIHWWGWWFPVGWVRGMREFVCGVNHPCKHIHASWFCFWWMVVRQRPMRPMGQGHHRYRSS